MVTSKRSRLDELGEFHINLRLHLSHVFELLPNPVVTKQTTLTRLDYRTYLYLQYTVRSGFRGRVTRKLFNRISSNFQKLVTSARKPLF